MPKRMPKSAPALPEVELKTSKKREEGRLEEKPVELETKVVKIDRVTYVVAGGKRMRFRVLVVVGDRSGRVGIGVAKAVEIPSAIAKATLQAKKRLIPIPLKYGTIPYEIKYKYGSAYVLLKPASAGTGIIAGGPVRAVVELAGITDILSKMLGSENKINNVFATYEALKSLQK